MAKHALLSASSAHRWLKCPPSAIECANIIEPPSTFALEGTEAHELCEYKVNEALGRSSPDPRIHLEYWSPEMEVNTDSYATYVMEQLEEAKKLCPDPLIMLEQKLDFSKWVPEGFGTGDCVIVADDEIKIIDFKYGVGILVDAYKNPQMMLYALGALEVFDGIYDIQQVSMTIFQPRRDNVSTFTCTKEELLTWADEVLAPIALLAKNGEGEYEAGDHCQFCKIKATCRKRAEYNLDMAQYDFKEPSQMSPSEIADILPKVDELVSWANDIKDYALKQAMSGTKYQGFKLVEGRSTRKYTDDKAVADTVLSAGYDPYEKKLMGITAMTQLLGRKKFEELLGSMVYKPPGKPTLVKDADKRSEINTANDDFKDN